MYHVTAHALPGTYLVRDWTEAQALWNRITTTMPLVALVIMPDHLHLVTPQSPGPHWGALMSGYTRWRNARDGTRGQVCLPGGPPAAVQDRQHLRRLVRYVHLNPCRGRLVPDPLAWPFSTHRDATGFALPAVVARRSDPHAFHEYVSSDPTVGIRGTDLPVVSGDIGVPSADEIIGAVTSLARVPPPALRTPGPGRNLAVSALRSLTPLNWRQVARVLGLGLGTAHACPAAPKQDVLTVERVLRDLRFGAAGGGRSDPDRGLVPIPVRPSGEVPAASWRVVGRGRQQTHPLEIPVRPDPSPGISNAARPIPRDFEQSGRLREVGQRWNVCFRGVVRHRGPPKCPQVPCVFEIGGHGPPRVRERGAWTGAGRSDAPAVLDGTAAHAVGMLAPFPSSVAAGTDRPRGRERRRNPRFPRHQTPSTEGQAPPSVRLERRPQWPMHWE